MPIPLLAAAAIPAIAKGIYGLSQMSKGNNTLRNLERPQYEIPTAANEALGLSRQAYADPRMPGENVMYDRAALGASNALDGAAQMGGGIGSVAAILAQQNAQNQNIGIASANYQNAARQDYANALGQYANLQDQQWQMNKFAPYADQYAEARQQVGAGAQNAFAGLDAIGGLAAGYLGAKSGVDPSIVATDRMSQNQDMNDKMNFLLTQLSNQRNAQQYNVPVQRPTLYGQSNDANVPFGNNPFNFGG